MTRAEWLIIGLIALTALLLLWMTPPVKGVDF